MMLIMARKRKYSYMVCSHCGYIGLRKEFGLLTSKDVMEILKAREFYKYKLNKEGK